MAFWLMKTEPDDYSWDRFIKDGSVGWTGVRNHQALQNLRAMQVGEPTFFYRSVVDPAVIGIMRVTEPAHPDPTDPSGRFVQVRVAPERLLTRPVTLKEIKADARFTDFALVRQSRLSVVPVSEAHWMMICALGEGAPIEVD